MKLTFKGPVPGDVWENGTRIAEDAVIDYPAPGQGLPIWLGNVQNITRVLEIKGSDITVEWYLNAANKAIEKLLDQMEFHPGIAVESKFELLDGTNILKRGYLAYMVIEPKRIVTKPQ